MANDDHVALLKQGVAAWNAWRHENCDIRLDFFQANLAGGNLFKAELGGANLSGANLDGANLSEAQLGRAWLNAAHLSKANLRNAYFYEADLRADCKVANGDLLYAQCDSGFCIRRSVRSLSLGPRWKPFWIISMAS